MKYFSTDISKKQCTDAGIAVVLILLLAGYFTENLLFFKLCIPVLVLVMIVPRLFYPFAVAWFGLSGILGSIMSKILLSVIYFIFVIPVGKFRKAAGKDNLRLKQFKKSSGSVMITRDHEYTREDLEKVF